MEGAPNGNGARTREIVLGQLVWAAGIAATIAATAWAVAQWDAARERPLQELREMLAAQGRTLEEQGKALVAVTDFMNFEIQARHEQGAREMKRREWCGTGALKREFCANLLSDAEIAAMRR